MAKPPRMTAPKLKPVKPTPQMTPKATLGRAARVQGLEAGESRLAKTMPPKNKPATPTMSAAAKAATQAAISRAQRVQGEEAGESMLMKRKPPQVIYKMKSTPSRGNFDNMPLRNKPAIRSMSGESILVERKSPQTIRTTVNERATPTKKGR